MKSKYRRVYEQCSHKEEKAQAYAQVVGYGSFRRVVWIIGSYYSSQQKGLHRFGDLLKTQTKKKEFCLADFSFFQIDTLSKPTDWDSHIKEVSFWETTETSSNCTRTDSSLLPVMLLQLHHNLIFKFCWLFSTKMTTEILASRFTFQKHSPHNTTEFSSSSWISVIATRKQLSLCFTGHRKIRRSCNN